ETAGLGVGDQMRSLEEGLTTQRASLVTVAHALRADQEDFAALAESRTAQLSGFLAGASKDVAALSEVTTLGAQSISDLIAAAAGQKADQVFEARLSEARGLIEQSAALVEEAGAKTAARLDSGVAQARATLEQLQRLVEEAGARTAARLDEGAAQTRASLDQL